MHCIHTVHVFHSCLLNKKHGFNQIIVCPPILLADCNKTLLFYTSTQTSLSKAHISGSQNIKINIVRFY